jgi:hypothetical protein
MLLLLRGSPIPESLLPWLCVCMQGGSMIMSYSHVVSSVAVSGSTEKVPGLPRRVPLSECARALTLSPPALLHD